MLMPCAELKKPCSDPLVKNPLHLNSTRSRRKHKNKTEHAQQKYHMNTADKNHKLLPGQGVCNSLYVTVHFKIANNISHSQIPMKLLSSQPLPLPMTEDLK